MSVATGSIPLFNALLNDPNFAKLDFLPMRITPGRRHGGPVRGGRPLAGDHRRSGLQAYGLTETSPAATINPWTSKPSTVPSSLPILSTEVSIRNDDGGEVERARWAKSASAGPR